MKKTFLLLAASAAALCSGCDTLGVGGGPKMDSSEATELVLKTIAEKTDASEWKVYRVRWQEGEELGNELELLTVYMANTSGDCYTQTFNLSGTGKGTVSDLREVPTQGRVDFTQIGGIVDKIDAEAIRRQYEAAKAMIPEGYTFKSVSGYDIGETIPSGNEFMDRNKRIGAVEASFDLSVTEDGKEVVESAGKRSVQYYQVTFDVQPDGSVVMDE